MEPHSGRKNILEGDFDLKHCLNYLLFGQYLATGPALISRLCYFGHFGRILLSLGIILPSTVHGGYVILEVVSSGEFLMALRALENLLVCVVPEMGSKGVLLEVLGTKRALQQLVPANGSRSRVKEAMVN